MSAGFLRDKLSLIRTAAISRVFSTAGLHIVYRLILKPTRRWFSVVFRTDCWMLLWDSDSLEQKIKSAGRRSSGMSFRHAVSSKSIFLLFFFSSSSFLKKCIYSCRPAGRPHIDLSFVFESHCLGMSLDSLCALTSSPSAVVVVVDNK